MIKPAADGTKALEAGGICALRIGAFSFPTSFLMSSRMNREKG